MSFSEFFEFIFHVAIGTIGPVSVALALLAAGLSIWGLGILWGKLWNRKWGLMTHLPTAIVSGIIATATAFLVLHLHAANNALEWVAMQRAATLQQIGGSGGDNRMIFRKAWDRLEPMGGQRSLTPPAAGGNEIQVNNEAEAKILVMTAAESAASQLRLRGPFRYGLPLEVRDASAVASDYESADGTLYPITVNPANGWVKAGLSTQAAYAFDAAMRRITDPLGKFRTNVQLLLAGLLVLQASIVAFSAMRDIREDPV